MYLQFVMEIAASPTADSNRTVHRFVTYRATQLKTLDYKVKIRLLLISFLEKFFEFIKQFILKRVHQRHRIVSIVRFQFQTPAWYRFKCFVRKSNSSAVKLYPWATSICIFSYEHRLATARIVKFRFPEMFTCSRPKRRFWSGKWSSVPNFGN